MSLQVKFFFFFPIDAYEYGMYSNIGCALSWSEPDAETSITLKLRVCKLKSRHFK